MDPGWISVNVPVTVLSIFMNMIFIFCMFFPQKKTRRLTKLLNVLLGSLVFSNVTAHICILVILFSESFIVQCCTSLIAMYTMMSGVTSSHWLNVFYCCQIISVQHPFFIWLKRNIKMIIYSAIIVNTVFYLFGLSVPFAITSIFSNYENTTWAKIDWNGLNNVTQGAYWMVLSFLFFSLSVMLVSSCMIVVYLWRHLRNIQESSSSFTSSHRQRQIKSTAKGITVQALLHVFCSVAVIINETLIRVLPWNFDPYDNILCTMISLYFFGTTINMGFIQSVFRERVVQVWQTIFQPHSLTLSRIVHTISSDILSG